MIDQFELFEKINLTQINTYENLEQTMTDPRRKNYNKRHYDKNKSQILLKARERYRKNKSSADNIVPLFSAERSMRSPDNSPPNRKGSQRSLRSMGSAFCLHMLVAGFSYFLISETAEYFAQTDKTLFGPIFKALLLEGAVFAFWLKKPRTTLSAFFQKLMAVVIYVYTVCVVSGTVIHTAAQQRTDAALTQKTVVELESEIEKSTRLRDRYFQTDRTTLGMRLNRTLSEMRQQLEQLRTKTVGIPDCQIIWMSLFTLVSFRVLVMVSNLFCLNELARRYRLASRSI